MKCRKSAFSMRIKILMLCSLTTLLALSAQAVLFQFTSSDLVYNQAKETSFKSLQNMQDDFYIFITSIERNLINIYNQKEFISKLGDGVAYESIHQSYNHIARNMALWDFEPSIKINALYIYDINHHIISTYRHASTPIYTYPEDIYENSEEYNSEIVKEYVASNNTTMLASSYFNKSRQANILRFVLKIYTDNTTRKIGYIVCDIDEKSFTKIVQKYVYSQGQLIWLQPIGDRPFILTGELTDKKRDYYHIITESIHSNNKPMAEALVSNDSVFFEIPQKKYNLIAFSLTPQILLEESQRVLTRNLIIIAILIISIFFIASIILSKSLTTPLERMVNTMNKIKKGDTSLRLSNLKGDEIGKMGETFNQMLDQIENLIMKEYQSKLLIKNAEYKALQAQVNPHFLYNTLDTMSSIAASQQCNTVSSICKALSNIFRYSIDMKNSLSTIEKEIIHIKNYMHVMNIRMMNSINMVIKIDSELWGEQIPRISIQPLVENSILHGLKDKHGEKNIEIIAASCGENMNISVIDNGVGMDADKINKQLESSDFSALENCSSIGLENINSRVKLFFGDSYGIHIKSAKNEGSTVSLCIPRMGGNRKYE